MFAGRTLLWLAVAWICGMAVAASCPAWWIGAGSLAAFAAGWAAGGKARRKLAGAFALAVMFAAGAVRFEWAELRNATVLPPSFDAASAQVEGTIASAPLIDGDRVVFDIDVYGVSIPASDTSDWTLPGERMKAYVYLAAPSEILKAQKWKRGDRIRMEGELKRPSVATNFGGFDYRKFLMQRGTFWLVQAKGASAVHKLPQPEGWRSVNRAAGAVDDVRQFLSARLDALFEEPAAGFMKGLLIGVRDDLDPEQYRTFSQIGLTHILAISGLHVGLFSGGLLWLLKRFPMARETRLLIAMAAVPCYVILTGASPSAVRAGLMAVMAMYAARRRLLKDGLHILAAAAVMMLAYNPFYLFDVSFQLSFAVTAGLIVLVPPCMERMRFLRSAALRSACAVTLIAQLVSFPLTITYFNQFHLLSFPANFVLVPLFSIIVLPLGSAALLLSLIAEAPAQAAAYAAERAAAAGFAAADWLAQFHSASTIWATPPLWWIAAYYGALGIGTYALTGRLRRLSAPLGRLLAACCGLGAAALCLYAYYPDAFDRNGLVAVIDVGQGDAIYVRTPAGKHLLIDAGGTTRFYKAGDEWRIRRDPFEVGRDVVVPLLMRRGVHALDLLIATHHDADHIGGAKAVLRSIPVRRLLFNGTVGGGEAEEEMFRAALDRSVPITPLSRGDIFAVDAETTIEVLHPADWAGLREERRQNGVSLVLMMTMRGKTFLFAGDIGAAEERRITAYLAERAAKGIKGSTPPVDVLKVAHHGSKSSTGDDWLRFWEPKTAVISAGRNNLYGHPHPEVAKRLEEHGVFVFRTDMNGEIQFRVGAEELQVRTMLGNGQENKP